LLEKIDAGDAGELLAPNGWCTDERWRREIRLSCSVILAGMLEDERRIRGELPMDTWHLHVQLEQFQRTFNLRYARGAELLRPGFPEVDAQRLVFTWLIDWEAGHRWNQRIGDTFERARQRILHEYLQNGSRQLQ